MSQSNYQYMEWLIKSRAANQSTTLRLYRIIDEHRSQLRRSELFHVAQYLAGTCFALWSAAFLSDVKVEFTEGIDAVSIFLRNVLLNNAIAYPQDLQANHFTFRYYMADADFRLRFIRTTFGNLNIVRSDIHLYGGSQAVEYWDNRQKILDQSVHRFDEFLSKSSHNGTPSTPPIHDVNT